eukprot:INCI14720.2.p1 GENE.INCI14720.2~~INCI14720.2.p1  ORF type:complete len:560 (-),score=97.91 INCI14720.2:2311-3990(-)
MSVELDVCEIVRHGVARITDAKLLTQRTLFHLSGSRAPAPAQANTRARVEDDAAVLAAREVQVAASRERWRTHKESELFESLQKLFGVAAQATGSAARVRGKSEGRGRGLVPLLRSCATELAALREIYDTELAHAAWFASVLPGSLAAATRAEAGGSQKQEPQREAQGSSRTRRIRGGDGVTDGALWWASDDGKAAAELSQTKDFLRQLARDTAFEAGQVSVSPSRSAEALTVELLSDCTRSVDALKQRFSTVLRLAMDHVVRPLADAQERELQSLLAFHHVPQAGEVVSEVIAAGIKPSASAFSSDDEGDTQEYDSADNEEVLKFYQNFGNGSTHLQNDGLGRSESTESAAGNELDSTLQWSGAGQAHIASNGVRRSDKDHSGRGFTPKASLPFARKESAPPIPSKSAPTAHGVRRKEVARAARGPAEAAAAAAKAAAVAAAAQARMQMAQQKVRTAAAKQLQGLARGRMARLKARELRLRRRLFLSGAARRIQRAWRRNETSEADLASSRAKIQEAMLGHRNQRRLQLLLGQASQHGESVLRGAVLQLRFVQGVVWG